VSVPSQAAQQQPTSRSNALASQAHAKQTVDYTALAACCHELSQEWVPAKVEEVSPVCQYHTVGVYQHSCWASLCTYGGCLIIISSSSTCTKGAPTHT
jgi:hypothetical protein